MQSIKPNCVVIIDSLECTALPVFLKKTEALAEYINSLSLGEQKKLWACNDKIAAESHERFSDMDLRKCLAPAILAYDGIQYTYMAPDVLEQQHIDYLQENLRILSGFYGVLKPLDGVVPYRLEMQAKAKVNGCKNLYEFWGDSLYREVLPNDGVIINLASKEYSKCVEKYLKPEDRFITIVFGELTHGKVTQKGSLREDGARRDDSLCRRNKRPNPRSPQKFCKPRLQL